MKPVLIVACALLVSLAAMAAEPQSSELPPPIRALTTKGISIEKPMQAPPGFLGYVGEYKGSKLPVYLLPDEKHVLIGSVYDAQGGDLTSAPFAEASTPAFGEAEWQKLEQATWIAEGASKPDRIVYAFTDTECPYCHRLWQESLPLLKGGKTQIRHLIVAVISPKSGPRAAAILQSKDRADAFQRHEQNFGHSPFPDSGEVPKDTGKILTANAALMNQLGIFGTPALIYHDAEGKVRVQSGVPDPATLRKILLGSQASAD